MSRHANGVALPQRVHANHNTGFTLIEILVVLAIVSVMILAAGLSVDSGGPSRRVAVEAQRLAALIELACDESAQFGQEIGVRFEARGYRFVRAVGREWERRGSDSLRARRLPDGMRLNVQMDERLIELDGEDNAAAELVRDGDDDVNKTSGAAAAKPGDLAPHLACDAEGVLSAVNPRIEIKAGDRSAWLTLGEDGVLQVTNAEQPE